MSAATATIGRPVLVNERELFRNATSADDRSLADALKQGDQAGMDAVWHRYGKTVFAYLLRALRDRGEAEDVHQQVFLEIWKRRAQYDPARAGLFTWVMTIARSRAVDNLRQRRPDPVDAEAGAILVTDPSPGPEEQIVETWSAAQLLQRIPAEESRLLRMRFYEELTQTEIAEQTGLPLGTVKMRMVQALGRLRELAEKGETT